MSARHPISLIRWPLPNDALAKHYCFTVAGNFDSLTPQAESTIRMLGHESAIATSQQCQYFYRRKIAAARHTSCHDFAGYDI